MLAQLPTEPASRRRALAALLAADLRWLDTLHLFNEGFSWGAHEDWGQWYGFHPDDTRPGALPPVSAAVNIREGIFPVGFYDEVVRCSGLPIRGGGTYRRQRENSSSGL